MITPKPSIDLQERFAGLLLGTAVGDALGLPAENLSADRIRRRWKGQWKMRFILGRLSSAFVVGSSSFQLYCSFTTMQEAEVKKFPIERDEFDCRAKAKQKGELIASLIVMVAFSVR